MNGTGNVLRKDGTAGCITALLLGFVPTLSAETISSRVLSCTGLEALGGHRVVVYESYGGKKDCPYTEVEVGVTTTEVDGRRVGAFMLNYHPLAIPPEICGEVEISVFFKVLAPGDGALQGVSPKLPRAENVVFEDFEACPPFSFSIEGPSGVSGPAGGLGDFEVRVLFVTGCDGGRCVKAWTTIVGASGGTIVGASTGGDGRRSDRCEPARIPRSPKGCRVGRCRYSP